MPARFLEKAVFSEKAIRDFDSLALENFAFQYEKNPVYQAFCKALNRTPAHVRQLTDIPFIPISFFKNHKVTSFSGKAAHVFTSSGTIGSVPSRHYVFKMQLYERSFLNAFRMFYGGPKEYCVLALLPGYLERSGSSLVYMARRLMEESHHKLGGFFLNDLSGLKKNLQILEEKEDKVLLLGVSFALLEMAEQYPGALKNTIVMETGGMKGRRRELVREELHDILRNAFKVPAIHSEYGMTELFSQAYSKGEGLFECPPWMKVLIRDPNDPLSFSANPGSGGINMIDLANIYSCSFIATQDLGRLHAGGQFEVLGRFDHSDTRGCNLMVE